MATLVDLRNELWCFCYTVYWKDFSNIIREEWKRKQFSTKKEAIEFYKKMKKEYSLIPLKPYILEHIVPCSFFKVDLFEKGMLFIVNPEKYEYGYARKVK